MKEQLTIRQQFEKETEYWWSDGYWYKGDKPAIEGWKKYSEWLEKKLSRIGEITEYEIDFNGQFKTKIQVASDSINILGAMNGYGNGVPKSDIKINKLKQDK